MRRQPPSSSGTGFAEDEKAMELSAWPSLTFPDINPTISKEVKASVARLHVNAGHPNNQELKRLLATHGSSNSQVLTAIEHLRCGSCIRTSRPTPPRSASMPAFTLQLGERIQADIVWVRDMTGQNFPVLGVVCVATNFQVAARPASRSSAHCLDTLRTMWLVPFGTHSRWTWMMMVVLAAPSNTHGRGVCSLQRCSPGGALAPGTCRAAQRCSAHRGQAHDRRELRDERR